MSSNADIVNRIKEVMAETGLNQNQFAQKINVAQPNMSSILKGQRPCGVGVVNKVALALNINPDWLINGTGDRYMAGHRLGEPRDTAVYVPLLSIDSVGGFSDNNITPLSEQYVENLIPFPGARPGDVAITESGESMSPKIPAGSVLLLRRVEDWQEYFGYGHIYVLLLRDGRRITKRVTRYREDPREYVMCESINDAYPSEELPRHLIMSVWKVINILTNEGY